MFERLMASIMEAEGRGSMEDPDSVAARGNPGLPAATRTRVLAIEGNIGVGKSTVMNALKRKYADTEGVVFLDEPVDEWRERGFLDRMYKDPSCKPQFQHMVLMSLAGNLLKALAAEPRPKFIVMERSPWGNYHVFGRTNLTGDDLEMYKYTWENVLKGVPAQLDVRYIHMAASNPAHLVPRLRSRARSEEDVVGVDYLTKLEAAHCDGWLADEPNKRIVDGLGEADAVLAHVYRHVWEWMNELPVA